MLFHSLQFWSFFIIVLLLYYLLPQKYKWVCLLIASTVFYILCGIRACLVLFFITVIVFFSARCLERREKDTPNDILLTCTILAILVILGVFKYSDFMINNVNSLLLKVGWDYRFPNNNLFLPLGISFYSFKAVSYVFEVAWHRRRAENSLGKLALYLSFFPQIMAGPIERPGHFFGQLEKEKKINDVSWDSVLLKIAWGLFEKLVIADRLGILVDTVYGNYENYAGWQIAFASICFSLQILCDFDGYSNIAIGISGAFGFDIMKNFDLPYFSCSISEFWKKWHISLSSWFRDYLYIPLGGNRKGKIVKYRNILIVFLCSGLWHGAGWNFIIWGGLHGIYQIIGDVTGPRKKKMIQIFHISYDVASYKFFQGILTFLLVNFAWIFFKIEDLSILWNVMKRMFCNMNLGTIFEDGVFYSMGLDEKDFRLGMIAISLWLLISLLQKYIKDLLDCFRKQNLLFRWAVYYSLIFGVMIFGVYGGSYSAGNFIYISF